MKVFLKAIIDYANWLYIVGIFGILLCLRAAFLARRERERSIYTLEKEAATDKEFRVLTIGVVIAVGMGVVLFLAAVIAPHVTFVEAEIKREETPEAALVLPTVTPTRIQPTATHTPTPTRIRPTAPPITPLIMLTVEDITPTVTPTPEPPRPVCPNPLARLTAPPPNTTLSGAVHILGTANIENFDYYKIEYRMDNPATEWALITDLRRGPVAGGLLDIWDTTAFPNGDYRLRLVVVDITGNYPQPCEVRVTVSN